MAFSREKIDEIRAATDIVELVSDYLPLKRVGKYYRALCPFHNERKPSFHVNPELQIFRCFGCGKGGNVFSFLMEYEKFSFPESVEFLAKRAGIRLERRDASDEARNSLFMANDFASEFYHTQLLETGRARRYLSARGIGDSIVKEFKLGYAPDSWNALIEAARHRSISVDLLRDAGLALPGERAPYDMFRGRIIFPIFNLSNRVVGFGARSIDDSMPKYINTPETLIYKKGQILFGLNRAKADIRKAGCAVLVEGYTDFLSLYANGIKNCVAMCGTAFTRNQARLISRYTERVTLLFDSDAAGVASAMKSIDLLLGENVDVGVVSLPEGEDPDSCVRKSGKEVLENMLANAETFLSFKLRLLCGSDVPGQAKRVRSVVESIREIPDDIKRALWVRELSRKTGIEERALMRGWSTRPSERSGDALEAPKAESELLGMMLRDPKILSKVRSALEVEDFSESLTRGCAAILFGMEPGDKPADLLNDIEDSRMRDFLAQCLFKAEASPSGEGVVDDYIHKMRTSTIERRLRELKSSIEEQERQGVLDYDLLKEHQRLSELRRGA